MKCALLFLFACHGTPDGKPQPYVEAVGKGSGAVVDQITVNVTALRSDEGTVRCFLYNDGTDFPDSATHVIAKAVALPAAHAGTCVFSGVAQNRDYAIVILHDENNDDVFQKNALGIPRPARSRCRSRCSISAAAGAARDPRRTSGRANRPRPSDRNRSSRRRHRYPGSRCTRRLSHRTRHRQDNSRRRSDRSP